MAEKKMKFTAIDALIVIAVIIVIAVAGVMFGPSLLDRAEKAKVDFTVLLSAEDKGFSDAMSVGDNVTLSFTEKDGGVIKTIEARPAEYMVFDSINGEYKVQRVEDQEDIYVTIESDVDITDLYVKTGDTEIRTGEEIPVRGKGYASSGYIISVDAE